MAIQLAQWLVDSRVIYTYGEAGTVTLDEWHAHNQALIHLLQSGIAPIHIIFDSHPDYIPISTNVRQAAETLSFLRHSSLGWSVVISPAKFSFNFRSAVLAMLFGVRFQRVSNLSNAIHHIKVKDTSIKWDKLNLGILQSNKADVF